jgi:hypothetical protein
MVRQVGFLLAADGRRSARRPVASWVEAGRSYTTFLFDVAPMVEVADETTWRIRHPRTPRQRIDDGCGIVSRNC